MTDVNVSEERLRQLLDGGHEWEKLDYKGVLDLSTRRDTVELAKDVGAMQVDGGDIVIGADDHGTPSGELTEPLLENLDESRIRAKLGRYLPDPIPIRVARHTVDGAALVLIHVAPNRDGLAVFRSDGTYRDSRGTDRTVFRRGDVFVRHGSASERWEQRDWERVLERRERAPGGMAPSVR